LRFRGHDGSLTDLLRYIALYIDRKVVMCTKHELRGAGLGRRPEFARRQGFGYSRGRGRGGPRARRGDVRAAILALLAEREMHGYEMIGEIDERTDGAWTPSAGSIYPTLQLLEDEGLIHGEESAGKRRFSLTDEGRAAQEERAGEQAPWDSVRADAAPEQIQLRESVHKFHHAIGQVFHAADEQQQKRIREMLDETRRGIYAILAEQE
jgi:DNA-binding PadR family transcriptional regulator